MIMIENFLTESSRNESRGGVAVGAREGGVASVSVMDERLRCLSVSVPVVKEAWPVLPSVMPKGRGL